MESRLKERLTGAAILVALIVLIVPEIFHDRRSSPPPTGAPAAARAPRSAPTRSYTIELASPPPAASVQAAPLQAPPAAEPTGAVPAGARGEPRVAAATAAHGHGGSWTVQLGLFSKADNAARLEHLAQSRGFDVQISRYGSRGLYRVAIGGIGDRAAAEELSHRLRGAGLPAAILGPR